MTTHRTKRCQHCGTVYSLQMSGDGCGDRLNDSRYCPTCQSAVLFALTEVPKCFERSEQRVDVPLDRIQAWAADKMRVIEERRARGELVPVRVAMNLFDMDDPENKNITGYVTGQGQWHGMSLCYSYWTKKGPTVVTTEMEKNLATGELRPWREF